MPLATRNRRVTRWFQKIAKVLINALIIHVGTGRNLSGLATYQALNMFCVLSVNLVRTPGSIAKKCMKGHVVLLDGSFHVQAHGFKQGLENAVAGAVPFEFGSWRKIWNGCYYLLRSERARTRIHGKRRTLNDVGLNNDPHRIVPLWEPNVPVHRVSLDVEMLQSFNRITCHATASTE